MPQIIKKSAPVKKAVMPAKKAAVPVKKSAPAKKETVAERLNKVNPVSKAKYEAAMQKQWKSRPENQMKSEPKEAIKPKAAIAPKQMEPSNMIDAGMVNAIRYANSLRQETAPKKQIAEKTPKKN